ncbi:MAG: ImcF-related family protein, partial [Gemmatimonadaceae bacterium]
LRGFYFTGVQAVFVTDAAQEYQAAAAQPQAQAAGARSATGVFGPGGKPYAPPAAAASAAGGARKVPRWDFLPRVMREVVFGDKAAIRLTSAGARVGFWRKVGLATVIVLSLGLTTAFAISYGGNKRLSIAALDATRGIASVAPNPVDLPPPDALVKLDALRTQVDTLSAYEHSSAPGHLRWGLYSGGRLYSSVRGAYFAAFSKLMFAETRATMLTALRGLPDAPRPNDDYGDTYSLLKAYIITTSHPEKSTTAFLAPALMTRWLAGRSVDSARAQLARRQFETYASELRYANPFPDTADAAAVEKARTFLRQFAGSESIYQFMLAEAAKTNPPVQFNKTVAGSAPYVVDTYEVPGAYTKGGAAFMLNAFKTVDKYLSGENWVVGEDAGGVDKAKLAADLQSRYSTDYAAQWRKFLASAQVARYAGVKDAAAKLAVLSGNQSPLLALFSVASQNTAVALPDVVKTFQPVQLITPPNVTDKLIGEKNGPYVNALLTLQSSLDQTANAQGPAAEQAASQAANNATAARTAARQIAAAFNIDQQGQVHSVVQNLLEAPIAYAEPLLKNFGAAEINVRSRAFCSAARTTLAKFPFSPDATAQASLAEVAALIRPNSGSLWKFYNDALAAAVPKQGNQYVPKPDGSVKLSAGFITFLNRAQAFADVMFKDDSQEPHISVTVQPVPGDPFSSVSVSLEGEVVRSATNGNVETARVDWPGTGSQHEAKLSASNGGQELTMVGPYTGPWALFQLFNAADDWKPAGNGYRVGWELATRTQRATTATGAAAKIVVQIDAGPASSVLRRGFFVGSECGGDIAK